MPEGPEVRHYVDLLREELLRTHGYFTFEVLSGRYLKAPIEGQGRISKGFSITSIDCRGKFVYFTCMDQRGSFYILHTLGMTGSWGFSKEKHTRVEISNGIKTAYYHDVRNFGTFKVADFDQLRNKISSLGDDFLKNEVRFEDFLRGINKFPNKTIAEVLMDQSVFAGIGNYIKAEALYQAKLSPHRLCKNLNLVDSDNLWVALRKIFFDSYCSKTGGPFEKVVYRKDRDPLGHEVISETTKDKRITWWVPEVQT
jgi:formamidopyrimidine-DNA glycosylase